MRTQSIDLQELIDQVGSWKGDESRAAVLSSITLVSEEEYPKVRASSGSIPEGGSMKDLSDALADIRGIHRRRDIAHKDIPHSERFNSVGRIFRCASTACFI